MRDVRHWFVQWYGGTGQEGQGGPAQKRLIKANREELPTIIREGVMAQAYIQGGGRSTDRRIWGNCHQIWYLQF